MSILINENTRILVQGITGNEGTRATKFMLAYGSKVVAGVTPGKGGQNVESVPVYNSIKESLAKHPEINCSVILVPPKFAKAAMIEAIENRIKLINVITEFIPIHDVAECIAKAKQNNCIIVGPTSVGIISPGKCKIGMIGGDTNKAYMPGNIGIISKSGGMSSETAYIFKLAGIGQSTVVSIGGDVINGFSFKDALALFEKDPKTHAVVIFGEIGGTYEEEAAEFIKQAGFTKPCAAFISGKFAEALPNVTLGHAGAIIEGGKGTRESKVKALKDAGVMIAEVHHELVELVKKALKI
ncbi:CoA-binding protein [Candidatus Woesearchaeota archaeon]|nr:CoA-binding protein [Candidatus Woesearchaeota archaeon]